MGVAGSKEIIQPPSNQEVRKVSTEPHLAYSGKSATMSVMGLCAILMAFALAKEFGLVGGELAKRAVGMAIGAVLIVTGNVLPKFALPLSMRTQNPERAMATERFAGRTFCLTEFVFVAAWLFVPLEHVKLVSSLVGLGAFCVVIAAWVRSVRSEHSEDRREPLAPESVAGPSGYALAGRGAIFTLLHAVLWVSIIFLADSIWGDVVAQWTAVVFVIANGALISWIVAKARLGQSGGQNCSTS
jgi:hypothetical protein